MAERVDLDNADLQATSAAWRAAVAPAVAHPPIPVGATDPASALAASLCLPWPELDAVRDAARIARADTLLANEFATGVALTAADADGAATISSIEEV